MHLGKFKAVWSTSGKRLILLIPVGEKPAPATPRMDSRRQMGTGFGKTYGQTSSFLLLSESPLQPPLLTDRMGLSCRKSTCGLGLAEYESLTENQQLAAETLESPDFDEEAQLQFSQLAPSPAYDI